MNIGDRLSHLRKRRGISQADLARQIKYSQSSIAMWESGKRSVPDDAKEVLADYYNVSMDFLFGRDFNKDEMDLREMLESNIQMTYGGEELSEKEKETVQRILTGIFWEKTHKEEREMSEKNKQ